ncbi:glycoside hydrolase family 18 protein [Caulobacter endophyticus]|uniref:GH18 domain-containing protein n=1 Tax=Caulobacter endophyticus TaxID=2172652 RepID=A0A2T9KCL8_9CAUL|nr:hypothetical protein [Caulobacter endophyticus]PVM93710.1 hypothetical protein DDF67_02010 [Caulobacter endophyticus]
MSAYPIAIYGNGLFQDGYPTPPVPYATQAQQLNQGITTVILWSIHIHEGGDLYLNDTLFVSKGQIQYATNGSSGVNPDYPALVKQLMSGGSVRDLLVSVGAWGTTSDFTAWLAARDQVKKNLAVLQSTFGITGVDFDYEGDYTTDDQKMIVTLTLDVGSLGLYATYCPYTADAFWTGCLADVYAQNGKKQIVKWMNLQCYAGGAGNHPKLWAQLVAQTPDTGVTDPYAFIVPGYAVEGAQGGDPSYIQQMFAHLAGSGITGGFLWNSSGIFSTEPGGGPTPADYAKAISAGLGASTSAREPVDA